MNKKKNILFLFADDMRYDTIHALGNEEIKTPNLDEIVRNGTSFINACIPGGTFAAVCMPSRAMLNTGRSLFHLDHVGERIPDEHSLLGETMLQNGYNSFGTGKWHNCTRSYARSFNDGAEIFFGGMYDHWKVPLYHFDHTGEYPNRYPDVLNPAYDNYEVTRIYDHHRGGTHSTDLFADAACDYIKNYESDKPFYMYVAFMAPHDPRSMPKEYKEMYDLDKISLPPNFRTEHEFDFGITDVRDERLLPNPRDPIAVKRQILEYYAMISHLDAAVGRIIQTLKESGMYDDTIILFSADNGLAVGQHGLLGKQNCYNHSIKVPFVISGPGIPKNEIRNSYIYLYDVFPTLCDLVGIDVPETVDGISFKPVIDDASVHTRDGIFAVFADKVRSYMTYEYKLIEYKSGDLRRTQLFNINDDPWETNDLFWNEKYYPIVLEMREKLRQRAVELGDTVSEESTNYWLEYRRVKPEVFGY